MLYILQVTAEDESGIRIWDLRMVKFPVLQLPGHAHWYIILGKFVDSVILQMCNVFACLVSYSLCMDVL